MIEADVDGGFSNWLLFWKIKPLINLNLYGCIGNVTVKDKMKYIVRYIKGIYIYNLNV